jgi:uncharacterized protein (TIGR02099 family)
MNPKAAASNPKTRFLCLTSRLLLWTVIGFWVIAGAAGAFLHFWIVPRIGLYHDRIELEASKALGTTVKIGAVRAYSAGLLPTFEIKQFVLHDAANRPALVLGTVVATLSPRSLLSLDFEQLVIDAPELDIRRDKNGKVWVAGIDFAGSPSQDTSAVDWFFSQHNFQIRNGTVRWVDEQLLTGNEMPTPLVFTQVSFTTRNPLYKHLLRFEATPPPGWGDRVLLLGELTQSLVHRDRGNFEQWNGEIYANFTQLNLAQLRRHVKFDTQLQAGSGAARVWADIKNGAFTGGQLDMALNSVDVQLPGASKPLALEFLTGQLKGKRLEGGFEIASQALQFKTTSGLKWPGGNMSLSWRPASGKLAQSQHITADKVDLAVLRQLADSLPLGEKVQQTLESLAPQGLVKALDAQWDGAADHPTRLVAKGSVERFQLSAQNAATKDSAGRPGVSGASIDFEMTEAEGRATIGINQGSVSFPGIWEDPLIPISQLGADLRWQITPQPLGDKIRIQVSNGLLKSPDADGQFNAIWTTSEPDKVASKSRFPGNLNLEGKLVRADGARVWRYLPLMLPASARDYVRLSVKQGKASDAQFVVRGDLNDMPFTKPGSGQFLIKAKVTNAEMAYVPPSLQAPGEPSWPAFSALSGELVFNGASMEVRNASGVIAGLPNLKIAKANVVIADLENSVVKVQAQATGALDDMIRFVNQSPLKTMTGNALAKARASGGADYLLNLTLPVNDLTKTQVEGSVKLAGNDIQLSQDTPRLRKSQGTVSFNEHGFQIKGARAGLLGGDVEFEGGSNKLNAAGKLRTGAESMRPTDPDITIRGKGNATALGLQQAAELGVLPRFARYTSGSANYAAVLTIRNDRPELVIVSNLQGMAINLPAPLAKGADANVAFLYENVLVPSSGKQGPVMDTLKVEVGNRVAINYLRNVAGDEPKVIKGEIAVGLNAGENAPQPSNAVGANILLPSIDVDTWVRLFESVSPSNSADPAGAQSLAGTQYLPQVVVVRSNDITWSGRSFQNVVAGISREGNVWRANVDATQLAGYLEYKTSATDPRLYARLSRAHLGAAQQAEVEQVLDDPKGIVPALDLDIENLELGGRSLGRVQVEATNRLGRSGRGEWRLNKLQITKDFARLAATGLWGEVAPGTSLNPPSRTTKRKMQLDFKLDIDNAGDFMNWYGKEKTIRNGKGSMAGTINWQGSPFAVHYPSLSGQINTNLQSGQFLKVDPGAAKLLSVLSLQSLPRRLTLDFRDIFSEGFPFDSIKGDISIDKGIATTKNLQMNGLNALVLMEGSADIIKETQNMRVVVIPEISATGVSLAYAAINPAIGLGSLVAQWLLSGTLSEAATREYLIEGSWAEPTVKEVKRKQASKASEKPPAAAQPKPLTNAPQ